VKVLHFSFRLSLFIFTFFLPRPNRPAQLYLCMQHTPNPNSQYQKCIPRKYLTVIRGSSHPYTSSHWLNRFPTVIAACTEDVDWKRKKENSLDDARFVAACSLWRCRGRGDGARARVHIGTPQRLRATYYRVASTPPGRTIYITNATGRGI
jgi:hypothetical protein